MPGFLSNPDRDVIWPTQVKRRHPDGLIRAVDRSVWLWRSVPMAPIADAPSEEDMLRTAQPLFRAINEISDITHVPMAKRRFAIKGNYREVHALLVNVPRAYMPPRNHPARSYLAREFGTRVVWDRVLLFGVKLVDKTVTDGFRATVNRVADTLTTGETPLYAFDQDRERVSNSLARARLQSPTDEQMRLAENWINLGDPQDVPTCPCDEHLHVFDSAASGRAVEKLDPTFTDCGSWPQNGNHVMTFATVQEFDLPFVHPVDGRSLWAMSLVNREALCVSIRGLVEPGEVTAKELKRGAKKYRDDELDRAGAGKDTDADQVANSKQLEQLRASYETDPRGVLIDASVLVALPQSNDPLRHSTVQDLRLPGVTLRPMTNIQGEAWMEMQMGSPVRVNPYRHDLPAELVACAGLGSRSAVGDPTGGVVGFTVVDKQPAYVDWSEGARRGKPAVTAVFGSSGSGKSQLGLSLAKQTSESGAPTIFVDPKPHPRREESFESYFVNSGGKVFSLDNVAAANGSLDPVRFSPTPEDGIQMAVSMLGSANPFGADLDRAEKYLNSAITFGVGRGARSTGSALMLARDAGKLPGEFWDDVERQFSNPMFRALVGMDRDGEEAEAEAVLRSLRSGGLTLVQVGSQRLDLPDIGTRHPNMEQRIGLALVRMLVYGCTTAVAAQGGGAVFLDEAWIFLQSGLAELEKIARLGRSQNVWLVMLTQKPSDVVGANFDDHLSRVMVLHLDTEDEARAACTIARLDPTVDRLSMVLAGNGPQDGSNTLLYLEEPDGRGGRRVVRGSVVLYSDLDRRTVGCEVTLSEEFLRLASTQPEDVAARAAQIRVA